MTAGNLGETFHANEDRFASAHGPDKQWDGLQRSDFLTLEFWSHAIQDWAPNPLRLYAAGQSDIDLIRQHQALKEKRPKKCF